MEPITIKYRNSNGKFDRAAPDSMQRCRDTNALIELLTSDPSRYPEMIEICGDFDIDVIREELGHDFFGEDAIIFSEGSDIEEPWVAIYPSMDALMTPRDDDSWVNDYPTARLHFSHLCNFEGPLDVDRLFSVDDFMFVYDSGFHGCEHLDVNINYPTVGFWERDDRRYAFMNSSINKPIDKWLVDERVSNLDAWFANSEFNQPLNNWKLTKLSCIDGIFFRSKYNHPLDKWFSKPITISAVLAFAESECHQDLSMWKINPGSKCDGMFYKSKYTIEEVSKWPWVKNLNQPIEDLFRITEKAEEWHKWLLDVIEDYYIENNQITVKHLDKNDVFNRQGGYETVYNNVDALISDLTSGALKYKQILELKAYFDIRLIYEQLGSEFVASEAIIFVESEWVIAYPNMDTLMAAVVDYKCQSVDLTISCLCYVKGPLDADRLFNVGGFMAVQHNEFEDCTGLDFNINYPTIEFDQDERPCDVFMNSNINQPIDKWKVDEGTTTLHGWFVNSLFNQPLNNWKLTKLNNIDGIFFRSKYNHPLDKWFSKPITIEAEGAFAESEFHQDLSMWRINPDSKCDGMFYKSKYTIEEVSTWPWVKNLDTPIEDLFRITRDAKKLFSCVRTNSNF